MAYTEEELKKELETKEYEYGFYTDIESDTFPIGLKKISLQNFLRFLLTIFHVSKCDVMITEH